MEEEKIVEHKKFINERSDKPQEISMELIGQTSLRSESPLSEEEKYPSHHSGSMRSSTWGPSTSSG